MANPGNRAHTGYKNSIITNLTTEGNMLVAELACGHRSKWTPFPGYTAEAWAIYIQQGDNPVVIGKSRMRCTEKHE